MSVDFAVHTWTGTLRSLLYSTQALRFDTPYSAARLLRIAEQTEYFLVHWPVASWPGTTRHGHTIPAQSEVQGWIRTTCALGTQLYAAPSPSSLAWHQMREQLQTVLLLFS